MFPRRGSLFLLYVEKESMFGTMFINDIYVMNLEEKIAFFFLQSLQRHSFGKISKGHIYCFVSISKRVSGKQQNIIFIAALYTREKIF